MSPEQCLGTRELTDRSDVYSMGVLLYEMLAGGPPFSDAEGAMRVMNAHVQKDPPPLKNRAPDATSELSALVHRMLAKSPSARPSAAEVASVLALWSGSRLSTVLAAVPAPAPSPEQPPVPIELLLPPPEDGEEPPRRLASLLKRVTGRHIVIGAGVALFLGILGIVIGVRALLSAPPPPPSVSWSVLSEPQGAEVADQAGQLLGRTPFHEKRIMGRGLVTLTLRKRGYHDETVIFDRAQDAQQHVVLSALPAQQQQTATPSPPVVEPKDKPSPTVKKDTKGSKGAKGSKRAKGAKDEARKRAGAERVRGQRKAH